MGSAQSTANGGEVMPTGAYYHGAVEAAARERGIVGGYAGSCGSCKDRYLAGDDLNTATIREYANTLNSSAKSNVIKELIKAGEHLGLLKGATGDDSALIKTMLKNMPTGDKVKRDPTVQKALCERIAAALNQAHGSQIINTKLPAEVVCQHVAEVVSSLSAGMHTEFLSVYEDVRKVLKNLHALKGALGDDHEALMAKVKSSDDALLGQETTTLSELHGLLLAEINRQIQLLENLLNVNLMPAEKDLAHLLKSKKDIAGYIDKIDVKLGSDKFGKVIANILTGLGVTANFALLVENSLKKVGISLDDYAKGESVQKLREQITSNVMGKNLDQSQLHDYLNAAELLYKNFYRNKDIASAVKTGSEETLGDMYSGSEDNITSMYDGGATGGADEYRASVMDKRVADRKKLRKLIFNTFYRQINALFDQFVGNLNIMSMKVGTEIPLSDQLSGLRHVLQRINESLIRNKEIYYALIGYFNDAMSKSKKDTLLGDLKMVSSHIDTLLEMSLYSSSKQYFVSIQSQIKAIVSLIDRFSDEIAAKFGSSDCPSIEGGGDFVAVGSEDAPDFIVAGGSDLYDMPSLMYKSSKSINDAIRQFDYKCRVAQIKQNMNATSRELSHYAEKYEKLVAKSIADVLTSEKKVYDKLRKQLTEKNLFGNDADYEGVANSTDFAEGKIADEKKDAIKFLERHWEVKQRFWATIEAVDSYMRVFTDALIKNPNDIKDIKSMLDDVETLNDWYNEKTGNTLSGVFDYFPSHMHGNGLVAQGTTAINNGNNQNNKVVYPSSTYTNAAGHYYEAVKTKIQAARNADQTHDHYPGNPNLVTMPSKGVKAMAQAKKALEGLGVLKNLLSVFVHIGSTFGGQEIRKQVFMTPTQMYNNIIDYLQASAFAQGFALGDLKATDDMPENFYNSNASSVMVKMLDGTRDNQAFNDVNTYAGQHSIVHLGVTAHGNMGIVGQPASDAANAVFQRINQNIGMRSVLAMDHNANPRVNLNPQLIPIMRYDQNALVGPHQGLQQYPDLTNVQRAILFKKRWGIWMRSILPGLRDQEGFSFKAEDEYFVLMLKSIAAKVLTVTGMIDVFDRPMEFNGLSSIRMITGGSLDTPKVDAGAVALYLRIPLLAQFYRGIFGFTDPENPDNKFSNQDHDDFRRNDPNLKISMVPDIDGTFSGLIKFIFRRSRHVESEAYNDSDVKEIVREVNSIYQKMQSKHPKNTIMETINEFVAEVNRRYGIITKTERDEYEREFGYRYDYSKETNPATMDRYTEEPNTNYAILPGEGDDEVVRPSSAQKLLGSSFDISEKKSQFTISQQHKKLVYGFRCAIDKYFENTQDQYTFDNAIKSTQLKLKHESNDENRIKLIGSLIRGVDVYSKVDGMKYVLFHETVIGGLNMLSAIHTLLAKFKHRAMIVDIRSIEEVIWTYLASSPGAANMAGIVNAVNNHLKKSIDMTEEAHLERLIDYLFGHGEADLTQGGHNNGIDKTLKRTGGIGAAQTATRDNMVSWVSATADEVARLKAAYLAKADTPDKKKATTFMRFIFGRDYVMKELTESLFGISQDFQGLVDFKIEEGRILLNYGGLKSLIEDMFQHVSYFIDLLRPHVSAEIINKYTNKLVPGSYYWLHEQLLEKIIVGRPEASVSIEGEDNPRAGYASLDELMRRLSYTFQFLTRDYNVDGRGLIQNAIAVSDALPEHKKNKFDKVFAEMIFYDASKPNSGLIQSSSAGSDVAGFGAGANIQTGAPSMIDIKPGTMDSLQFQGAPGKQIIDTRFLARFQQLHMWGDEFTMNRSVLYAFNQLIAKYIETFYDNISGKVYAGLVNQFTGGAFNQAISNHEYTYPDVVPMVFVDITAQDTVSVPKYLLKREETVGVAADTRSAVGADVVKKNFIVVTNDSDLRNNAGRGNIKTAAALAAAASVVGAQSYAETVAFGSRLDADAEHVLFTSLSIILRNLVTNRITSSQELVHLQSNIADVPSHMKEKMRANLPAFRNLFKELMCRCEFIKKIVSQSGLDMTRVFVAPPTNNPWPGKLPAMVTENGQTKSRFMGILDSIVRGCGAIITGCEQTLREVGDDPKYLELYQNSIKDYKTQYGKEPFMPLTSSLKVLQNANSANYLDFFPIHSLGNNKFKLMYGMRSMLNQPMSQPLMEHNPGFASIVDSFNMIVDSREQADKSRADSFLKTYVKMLRFAFEAKSIKGLLTPYILDDAGALLTPASAVNTDRIHFNGSFNRDNFIWSDKNNNLGAQVALAPTNKSARSMATASDLAGINKDAVFPIPAFALSKDLLDVIKLTESSFKDDKIKELVTHLYGHKTSKNSLEVQNIIDLNINPINVHALMREVPLINLYNYAYTFDRLIIELYYGLGNNDAKNLIIKLCETDGRHANIKSAKDMLVALLLDPYMDLHAGNDDPIQSYESVGESQHHYEKYAKGMLVGAANNGELGRPKFLSDQIYNKAIFGEMYVAREDYNEMGPSAAHVSRSKLSQQVGVGLMANIMRDTMIYLRGAGAAAPLGGLILVDNVNAQSLTRLCTSVAKYVAQNPGEHLDDVQQKVYSKIHSEINEFKELRLTHAALEQAIVGTKALLDASLLPGAIAAGNEQANYDAAVLASTNASRQLAIYVSLMAKLIHFPVARLVNKSNSSGYTQLLANECATMLTINMMVLGAVGQVAGPFLGTSDGVNPTGTVIEAKAFVLRKIQDGNLGHLADGVNANAAARAFLTLDGIHAGAGAITDAALPGYLGAVVGTFDKILDSIFRAGATNLPIAFRAGQNVSPYDSVDIAHRMSAGIMAAIPKDSTLNTMSGTQPPETLHWLKPGDNDNQIESFTVDGDLRKIFAVVGRLRFDTVFIRNLIFIVNLYRSLRIKLSRDLMYNKDIITRSAPITGVHLTEFFGNEVDQPRDDYGKSKMWKRYNY